MGKSLLLVSMLTVFCANLFGQSINSVIVSPQNPTSADEVSLVITGDRWSSDMVITDISVSQNSNTWTVDIEFMAGGIGLPVIVPFDTIVSLGTMAIGYYDCQVSGIVNGDIQDFDGTTWAVLEPVGLEDRKGDEMKFMCTPNPFSTEATINLSLPTAEKVVLKIYDVLGQEVATVIDEHLDGGIHQKKYMGAQLPAVRYYFHLSAGDQTLVQSVLKK